MSQRGFTLIEMALVFVLIGLIVGGGLFAITPVLDKTRTNQTNTTLDQVESALQLFVTRYNYLPCPADGSNTSASATYGTSQPTAPSTGGTGTCTVAVANSVIPWITLGLEERYSIDAWGNRLSYWTSDQVSGSTVSVGTPLARTGTNSTTWPSGTYLTVTDVVSGQAVTQATALGHDQAAYVLVSHGKSGWYSWSKNGGSNGQSFRPLIAVAHKACNSAPTSCSLGANSFASGGPVGKYPPTSGTYFDDIVRWRSPALLIQLCGPSSCGNPS